MRVLKFIVNNKNIIPDPTCNFAGLLPGAYNQVRAEFAFSPDWKNRVKVVAFWSVFDKEYEPQELKDGKSCMIPTEVLEKVAFKVQVLGKYKGVKTETNCLTVYQSGGN